MGLRAIRCCCVDSSSEIRNLSSAKFGHYFRKSDGALIQRFRCLNCLKTFSTASFDPCFRQLKRKSNSHIGTLLVSGVSQRRAAKILRLNRKTIVRKFIFLGEIAQANIHRLNLNYPLCKEIEFDDLETIEHTKLKPLSVTIAVEKESRRILGFRVARMRAKGPLSELSLKKYGPRRDFRKKARRALLSEIKVLVEPHALIKSDENPHYRPDVKEFFPHARHETHKGRRAAVVGQGELKKIGFDPLFSLNHTCAMLRANLNRLFRRTWCTTKKPERLALHIALYVIFHNSELI